MKKMMKTALPSPHSGKESETSRLVFDGDLSELGASEAVDEKVGRRVESNQPV